MRQPQERTNAARRARYAATRERQRAIAKRSRQKHADRVREAHRAYAARNAVKKAAAALAWRKANPERDKAMKAAYRAKNLPQVLAWNKARAAQKLKAMPQWAHAEAIAVVYAKAAEWSKRLGIRLTVDHVVPLRSAIVCGLHCEANLQVLSYEDNVRKQNRGWPDEPVG